MNRIRTIMTAVVLLALPVGGIAWAGGASLQTRMESIVLPDLDFRQAAVPEIVDAIVEGSRKADPEGVGVSIIVKDDARGTIAKRRLTLAFRKTNVARALRLLAASAELYVRVDSHAIIMEPSTQVVRDGPPPADRPPAGGGHRR